MARTPLRSVKPGDPPPELPIASVADAAARGTTLDMLKQMRRVIALRLDDPKTPAVALAALANRQLEIGREIDALEREADEDAREHEATPDDDWDASAI